MSTDEVKQSGAKILEKYSALSADIVVMIYSPFFILVTWIFYDELEIGPGYEIKERDYIYYFLFSLVIIPFQIVIDILSYNIVEYYHGINIHSYLESSIKRFKSRSCFWKGLDDDIDTDMGLKYRTLDQMCFSSQYYFAHCIFLSAMGFVMLGTMITTSNGYDFLADGAKQMYHYDHTHFMSMH